MNCQGKPFRPGAPLPLRGVAAACVSLLALPFLASASAADEEPARAIWVMTLSGSNVRRVVDLEAYRRLGWPRWSHDGKQLAFAAQGGKLGRWFIIDAAGKNLRDLGGGTMPDWSPDDKQIVFQMLRAGRAGIWVQNTDGRGKSWLADGRAARFSPDGSRIALLGPLRILDMVEGKSRPAIDPKSTPGEALGCQWSPDGRRLAAVMLRKGRRELILVDVASERGDVKTRLAVDLDDAVAWSPDGKQLAASIRDPKLDAWLLHLIAVDGDDPPQLIEDQQGDNLHPAFSPDGKQLAFASTRKGTGGDPLAVAASPGKLQLVRRHDKGGTVYSVAFSPDGRIAFLGGDMAHRGMQIWDVNTGDVVRSIRLPGIFVAISPDGRRAACAEFVGGGVQYLDLDDGSVIREFAHGAQVLSLQFSRDGARLVSSGADKNVCVFDVASGAELVRVAHDDDLKQVAFSPDGELFATTSTDKKLRLWETATGRKVREIPHPATPWSVAFSPDGQQIATGTGGELVGKRSDLLVAPSPDNTLRIWTVATGKLLRELKGNSSVIASISYSPDGKRIVSASFDRSLRLWDVESGRQLSRADGSGWFTSVAFSFDGRQVLAGGGAEKDVSTKRWLEFPDERVRLYTIGE